MDKFIELADWIKEKFEDLDIVNRPSVAKEGTMYAIIFLVKRSIVQIDHIHIMYYKGTNYTIGFINGKEIRDIKTELTEYKEQCLINSKSMLVS